MKKIRLLILTILVISIGGIYMLDYNKENDISNLSGEEEIILNRYREMQQAMVDRDIDKLNSIVQDGTTFTHMSGKTQSKDEYFEDIRTGALDYQSYTIDSPKVIIDGDHAVLEARVTLTANAYGAQGSYPFHVLAYFVKIDEEWFYRNKY